MKLPQSLLDAQAAVEAHLEREGAISRKQRETLSAGEQAGARMATLDRKIGELKDILLEDDVLAGLPAAARMAATVRAATEKQIAASIAERADLASQFEQSVAGSAALSRVAAERAQDLPALAKTYLAEWKAFRAAVWGELHRDVAALTLPELFRKWFCIAEGLMFFGMMERLNEVRIIGPGAILGQGQYHDPDTGTVIDWRWTWRSDPALIALNQSLIAIAAFERRMGAIVQGAADAARRATETERLDETKRAALLALQPKGYTTTIPQAVVHSDANPGRPAPEYTFSFGFGNGDGRTLGDRGGAAANAAGAAGPVQATAAAAGAA